MRIRSEADVIVCGAGTAGAIAAIGAARTGARTLLVDRYGSVGGMASTGMAFLGVSDAGGRRALGGIGQELFERLEACGAAFPDRPDEQVASVTSAEPLTLQQILLTMLLEARVRFLLHTFCVDALVEQATIRGIVVANKAGLEMILGEVVVDATGDGDIAARAGARFVLGRQPDGLTQPATRIFRVGGVNVEEMFAFLRQHPEEMSQEYQWKGGMNSGTKDLSTPSVVMDAFPTLVAEARAAGELTVLRDRIGIGTGPIPGTVTINATRVHGVDGTDPEGLSYAEVETQRQMFEVFQFLKRRVPGFKNARLLSSTYQVGIRESRHILGEYVLTQEDVLNGRDFADTVARGAYPLDLHDVRPGAEVLGHRVRGGGVTLRPIDRAYGIPLRCLIPVDVNGVIVAGRAISATHEASGSVRGQAVCMATGHAAGTIAAMACQGNTVPRRVDVKTLQQKLTEQKAILFYPEQPVRETVARISQ